MSTVAILLKLMKLAGVKLSRWLVASYKRYQQRRKLRSASLAQKQSATETRATSSYSSTLEYFPPKEHSFTWPSTDAPGGKGKLRSDTFVVKEGLLSYLGYRVGNKGLRLDKRRLILDKVFLCPLPMLDNAAYLADWGKPASATRLHKLAEAIAAFTRNAKRNYNANMEKSIRDWESDLGYLKQRYYDKHFYFDWPTTDV